MNDDTNALCARMPNDEGPPLPPTSSFHSLFAKPAFHIPKQQPKDLVWVCYGVYWYAAVIYNCPMHYVDEVVSTSHPHRHVVDMWMEEGKENGQLVIVVHRKFPHLNIYEHCYPLSSTLVESNYQQFLYKRTYETHQFSQVKVRGQCSHCKARVCNQCQAKQCGKFSCMYHSECLQHHWWWVVNKYDYFVHQPLPFEGYTNPGSVSLKEP